MNTYENIAHRKAGCRLQIIDEQGMPVANTELTLTQTNHEFLFGCNAFDFLPYANVQAATDENLHRFLKERVDKWLALFNYGTLPLYWGSFEYEEGNPKTADMMNAAEFLQDQGVTLKGHPLCWHTVCADWLMQYDNQTILQKQLDRIHREVTTFKGVIDKWDVINEVVIMPIFDRYDNAVTRICKELGRVGLIKEVFAAAKAANPDAELLINDFNTSIAYEILIDGCLQAGVPISTIGIQSHQHQGFWGAEKLEEVLARYEHFELPIHFTENTLVSGPLVPPEIEDLNDFHYEDDASTPEFEERQADELEEMYRILFAHPQVKGITGWDFGDGAWLNAPSGLVRRDNSSKPAYDRLLQLIKKEWWTDCTIRTNADGIAFAEGFKGEYLLTAGSKSAAFTLKDGLTELQLQMK